MVPQVAADDLAEGGTHQGVESLRGGAADVPHEEVQLQVRSPSPVPQEVRPHPLCAQAGEQGAHRVQQQVVLAAGVVVEDTGTHPVRHL
jgi:hypothetical protein